MSKPRVNLRCSVNCVWSLRTVIVAYRRMCWEKISFLLKLLSTYVIPLDACSCFCHRRYQDLTSTGTQISHELVHFRPLTASPCRWYPRYVLAPTGSLCRRCLAAPGSPWGEVPSASAQRGTAVTARGAVRRRCRRTAVQLRKPRR